MFNTKHTKIARIALLLTVMLLCLFVGFNLTGCGSPDEESSESSESSETSEAVVLSSIKATYSQGDKTVYTSTFLGDLKPDLKVVGINSDGSEFEITDYILRGALYSGSSTVTVSYESFETTFEVYVTPVDLASIKATYNQDNKVIYTSTSLDDLKADLSVVGIKNDGSKFKITDYALSGELTAGSSTITVSYAGFEATFTVNVTAVEVSSIRIDSLPTKTHYIETESVDMSGFVLTAVYNDGSEKVITDYKCDLESVSLTDSKITVSYGGAETDFAITVEKKIVSLSVSKKPSKTSYVVGEKLDLSGLEIKATYLDGTSEVVEASTNKQTGDPLKANDVVTALYRQEKSVEIELDIDYVEYEDFLLSYAYRQPKVRALGDETVEYKISKYVGEAARLVIPKDCAGIPITEIENFAFENCNFTMITVGDNITYVYSDSFKGCENTVIATDFAKKPEGWTDWDEAKYPVVWAYTSIVIDDYFDYGVSNEKVYIVGYKGLSPVVIIPEEINGYPVVSVTAAFSENKNLTNIVLPESLEVIDDYAFSNCSKLTSIEIPDSATSIGERAFSNCDALTSIKIPDSVTSIGSDAFYDCYKLTTVTIGNGVTSIGSDAFYYCSKLDAVYISDLSAWCNISFYDYNANPLYYADNLYLNGELVTNLVIPSTVTEIKPYVFYNCESLTSVIIPDSVTSIGSHAFYGCFKLTSINVDENNKHYKSIDGNLYSNDGKTLIQYAKGKKDTSFEIPNGVTSIGNSAFYYCTSLTSVTIPSSVTSIGSYAFYYCTSLTSITIPDSVTSIGYDAFYYCTSLTSVTIGDSVTSIGDGAFEYCSKLTSIIIPDSVTSIGYHAFSSCDGLTSIIIPDSVTSIREYAFSSCDNLTSIVCESKYRANNWNSYWKDNCNATVTYLNSEAEITTNSEFNYTIIGGNAILTKYKGDKTEVVIPDVIDDTYAVVGFSEIFKGNKAITSIVIGNNVTSIDEYAFYECTSLTSITNGYNVTSIGNSAFYGCSSLASVTIPNSVTSIGDSAFRDCDKLASITIPSSVKTIGYYAFYGCSSLTSVTVDENNEHYCSIDGNLYSKDGKTLIQYAIGKSETSFEIPNSVTSIGSGAFYYCSKLTSVTIGNSVTSIGSSAFYYCSSLTSVTIPDSIISIGYSAFNNCSSLTSVNYLGTIEQWCNIDFDYYYSNPLCYAENLYLNNQLVTNLVIPNTVTEIKPYAFWGYSSLTSVKIPDSVTAIGGRAFYGCNSLASVTIGDGVKSIGYEAFYSCDSLISVTIPNSVTSIGDEAFRDCDSLTNVTIGNSVETIGDEAFYSCDSLTSVKIPDSVTSIGDSAFYYCSKLEVLDIPQSVTSLGSEVIAHCTSLRKIILPSMISNLSGDLFVGCSSLAEVYIREGNELYRSIGGNLYDASGKTLIRYMSNSASSTFIVPNGVAAIASNAFSGITNLKSVIIPDSVISIGANAFYGCKALTSVTIPNSVTSIGGGAFSNCSSLTSITIPDSVTSIGNSAFAYCSSLTSVTIGNSVTSIGNSAFYYCNSLTSVTIPSSVKTIDNYAFYYCTSLTSVTIGDSVTSIGNYAFEYCYELTSVKIGTNVTSIGDKAFYSCYKLTSINVDENNEYYKSIDKNLYSKNGKTLIQYAVGKAETSFEIPNSVETIGNYAFRHCSKLTSINIPSSVTSIGDDAFYQCSLLTSVTIGNGVTSIGEGAFSSCDSLTSVTIPSSVTAIGEYAFSGCERLTSIVCDSEYATSKWSSKWKDSCNATVTYLNSETEITTNADFNYIVMGGNAVLTEYKGDKTEVVVPDVIDDTYAVVGFGEIFRENKSITSIVIGNNVTSIGERAFAYCSKLTNVTIGNSVTTIGNNAFYYCSNLDAVYISDISAWCNISFYNYYANPLYYADNLYLNGELVTNLVIPSTVTEIKPYVFYGCDSFTSVTIPSSVTTMGEEAFRYCNKLASLNYLGTIEQWCNIDFDGYHANPIGCTENLYLNNQLVTNLVIPSTVTEIKPYAFYNCESLTSVEIPEATTRIGSYAFSYCNSLISLTLSNGVTLIGDYAFQYCTRLASITIDSGLTSIGDYAFYYCSSLTSIKIPDSVTSIGGYAFSVCERLTSIEIPDSVTSIGDHVFEDCFKLTSIDVDENNEYYKSIDGNLYSKDEKTLVIYAPGKPETSFKIPNSVETIGDFAFYRCSSLTSIEIPDSVTSIGSSAFSACSKLTSITIPSSVGFISDNAFDGCSKLHIFFEGAYTEFVTDWNPDNRPVHYNTVMYKSNAEFYVEVLGDEARIVKYIGSGGAVVIPDVIVINSRTYKVVEIADNAFSEAENVTSILIGAGVKSIGKNAFTNCPGLTEVYLAENNESFKLIDGIFYTIDGKELLFVALSDEKTITIPEGVEIIHREAFVNAKAEEIIIPASVKVIESLAFYGNKTLKKITVSEDNEAYTSVDGILFDKGMETIYYYPVLKDGTVYNVPTSVTYVEAHCFINDSLKVVFVANNGVNVRNEAFTYNQTVVLNTYVRLYTNVSVVENATSVCLIDGIVYALCSDNSAVVIYNPEELDVPDQITVDEAVYTVTHATV